MCGATGRRSEALLCRAETALGGAAEGEVKERAQALLDEGKSVPAVGRTLEVLPDTLHKAIGDGRLRPPKKESSGSERDREQ